MRVRAPGAVTGLAGGGGVGRRAACCQRRGSLVLGCASALGCQWALSTYVIGFIARNTKRLNDQRTSPVVVRCVIQPSRAACHGIGPIAVSWKGLATSFHPPTHPSSF